MYNTEDYIEETLLSILEQNYQDYEVIVVDDGSSDNGPDIVGKYSSLDSRIKLLNNSEGKGVSGARNSGIKVAQGKYIAFLDSDDLLTPGSLKCRVELLEKNTDCAAVCSDFIRFNDGESVDLNDGFYAGKPEVLVKLSRYDIGENNFKLTDPVSFYLKVTCLVWTGTMMVRKSELDKVSLFDRTLSHGEDDDLWYRLSNTNHVLFVLQPLAAYRIRNGSATSNHELKHLGKIRLRNKIVSDAAFSRYKKLAKKKRAVDTISYAYYLISDGRAHEACVILLKSIANFPLYQKSWRALLSSIAILFK